MEQRRKIIIPTGHDPEETLATPHFDAEATLSAQPVVPLAEAAALPPDAYNPRGAAAYSTRAASASSPWKRSTLLFIILAAVGIGILSGLAIGLYQTRKTTTAPVAAQQPSMPEQQQAARQPEPEPAQPAVVEQQQPERQPEAEARVPDTPSVEEPKRRPSDDADADDEDNDDRRASRDDSKRERTRTQPPVVRERPTVTVPIIEERDDEDRRARREERKAERRERRREERRRQRDDDDYPVSVPRSIERARQDINRIRDIFEGRQP